jgi:hypothetical protein
VSLTNQFLTSKPGSKPFAALRPGPQPHNRIAGTAAEQYRRALIPRGEWARRQRGAWLAALVRRHTAELRPLLLELLGSDFADVALVVAREVLCREP